MATCPDCGKQLRTSQALSGHRRLVHPNKLEGTTSARQRSVSAREGFLGFLLSTAERWGREIQDGCKWLRRGVCMLYYWPEPEGSSDAFVECTAERCFERPHLHLRVKDRPSFCLLCALRGAKKLEPRLRELSQKMGSLGEELKKFGWLRSELESLARKLRTIEGSTRGLVNRIEALERAQLNSKRLDEAIGKLKLESCSKRVEFEGFTGVFCELHSRSGGETGSRVYEPITVENCASCGSYSPAFSAVKGSSSR